MALQASIKNITPPGSVINSPPTPPPTGTKHAARVARILRVFRDCQNGAPPRSPWTACKLNSEEYEQLQDRLKHEELLGGFVADKVRYDYDPIQSRFILRMPTVLHDTFISRLVAEIEKTLERLANTEIEARPFIEGIKPVGGVLDFPIGDDDQQQNVRHEPDIRFQHKNAAWPGVVIEVAYSQKRKSLLGLADNYILGSYGGIGVVVGLDLDYRKSKEASISVWRLKNHTNNNGEVEGEVEQVVDNQLFRDAKGNHLLSPSSCLKLSLKDFAVEEITHGVPDLPIMIDSKTLCNLLGEAENWDNKTMTMQGAKPPRFKRKWRPQTPPEQLTFSDEEKFAEEERRVRRKSKKLDKPYNEEGVFAEDSSHLRTRSEK